MTARDLAAFGMRHKSKLTVPVFAQAMRRALFRQLGNDHPVLAKWDAELKTRGIDPNPSGYIPFWPSLERLTRARTRLVDEVRGPRTSRP